MKILHFNICIQAPAEKVWNTLWNSSTYSQWSAVFAEGSRAESDWQEGSRVRFVDGMGNGVYGQIEELVPNRRMSIRNLGQVWYGRDYLVDESVEDWSGSIENYNLNEKNGGTSLWVEIEVDQKDAELFVEKFPAALQKIKDLAENEAELELYEEPAVAFRRAG